MEDKKLVIDTGEKKELPKISDLKLNLNGHKRKGKNLYKLQLYRIRRVLG